MKRKLALYLIMAAVAIVEMIPGAVTLPEAMAAPTSNVSTERPSKRIDYAIAYVPFLHSLLMQGGWAPPGWITSNEAWKWDGRGWRRWRSTGAPAFAHHTMAFDAGRNVVVICGRSTPSEGGEYQVWEFDGGAWRRMANVPVGAAAQGDPKLTYDENRKRLVLYVARTGGTAEIWEFEGKNWRLIRSPHEPVRCDENGCQFQYDNSLKKSVLIGEARSSKQPLAWNGHEWGMAAGGGTQTWLWDGTDWTRISGQQPPRAVWGSIAFDDARRQLVLLTTRMETWTIHENKWVKLHPDGSPLPNPNGFFAMGYDPEKKVNLFFGGESRAGEKESEWSYPESTWMYDGTSWTLK